MNKKKLRELINTQVRLRPVPVRVEGEDEIPDDTEWTVLGIDEDWLRLSQGGRVLQMGLDSVRNFHRPHFLVLHSQVLLHPDGTCSIEPLIPDHVRKPTADEVLVRALRDNARAFCVEMQRMEELLQPGEARDRWFEARERDTDGAVRLPAPDSQTGAWFRLPLASLVRAHDEIVAERRVAAFDPLAD